MDMRIKVLPNGEGLELPKYETDGAAGFDLRAAIEIPALIRSGELVIFPCGVAIEVPAGYEAQVRGRGGLGHKHGISVIHGVGTVDSDYRGELMVGLVNHSGVGYVVAPGDRIAQVIIAPVVQVNLVAVNELSDTERGEGRFTSTGKN